MNPIEEKRPDERLGAYLARAREARGLSVEELANVTKLTEKNISLIESGDWKAFPVEAYLKGYLNSICSKLGLDSKRIMDYYAGEAGTKFSSLLTPAAEKPVKVSPMTDEERKPRNKAIPIVIVLLGLAFVVGSHFLGEMDSAESAQPAEKATAVPAAEAPAVAEAVEEMPEGAVSVAVDTTAADSVKADSSVADTAKASDEKVTQAVVDEAVKKSDLPASATIFISSTSKKDDSLKVEKTSRTRIELVGSGDMHSWVGLKRHEEDGSFLKEANIAEQSAKFIYDTEDTLYVVVGEPRAISKMLLNGVVTKIPEVKYGRASRFSVFGGEIVKKKGGR